LRAALLLIAGLVGPAAAQDASDNARWYAMVAEDGSWVGHGSRETVDRPGGREMVEIQKLSFQESDELPTLVTEQTVTRLDAVGRPVTINEYVQTGRSWARREARIGAAEARIVRRTRTERREVRVPLATDVRFDNGVGLLPNWDRAAVPRLEFHNFNLEAMAVDRVTIEPVPGDALAALRKRYHGNQLLSVARLTLDTQGRILSVAQPMFGTTITIRPVSRREALAPRLSYRMLRNAMVKSPFRIPPAAMTGHIRYRFGFHRGLEFAPPETGEQRVAVSNGGARIDVCIGCGPGLASDPATLADALKPTPWLQSDHPRLKAIAGPIARKQVSDARKMEMLIAAAAPYLVKVDFAGHFSALETLDRRTGDCTEAAVLLAALGRAAGIPTRVANGLTYSRARYHGVSNVFMPHSWTLAWADGKWRAFDLAMFGFDSTHIALTIGDGDARSLNAANQLAGLLRWEAMTEVRTAPAK
jgi:hypothetical protein